MSSLFTPFFFDTFSVSFPKFQVSASTAATPDLLVNVGGVKIRILYDRSESHGFSQSNSLPLTEIFNLSLNTL